MFEHDSSNYYAILDIKPDASQSDIRQAYFRVKAAYSKDSAALYSIFDHQETHLLLEKIEQAYLVLSNAEKRKEYDKIHGFLNMASDNAPTPFSQSRNTNIFSFVKSATQQADAAHQAAQTVLSGSSLEETDTLFSADLNSTTQPENPAPAPAPVVQTSFFDSFTSHDSKPTAKPIQDAREFETKVGVMKRVDLVKVKSSEDAVLENEIKNELEYRGAFLKRIREYRNISLEELSEFTKIGKSYLAAIESEEYDNLPASVYIRGFIVQVAKSLKLPSDKVATGYMGHYKKTFMK